MSRARVILGAVALLCVPAGIVLIAVAVLRENPPPDRTAPAFATTGTTALVSGAWLVAPDPAPVVAVRTSSGDVATLEVVEGGIAVDDDRVLGGTIEVTLSPEAARVTGLDPASVRGHLVVLDSHDVGADDASEDEVVMARLDLGNVAWSVPGSGRFVRDDGAGHVRLVFEGTARSGTGDPDPPDGFVVTADAVFEAPS